MAGASVVLIVRCVLRLQRPAEVEAGWRLHRGALLLVLVGWAVLIPVVGFFLASVADFVASALTARYEPWSAPRWAGARTKLPVSTARARSRACQCASPVLRSEEHTSGLQSLMSSSYAVFCLKKKTNHQNIIQDVSK